MTTYSRNRYEPVACTICGQPDRERLRTHAVAGIQVMLCHRCRGELIRRTTPAPQQIWTPPDSLESIARALMAEADLLSLMAQSRWLMAYALIDRVRRDEPIEEEPPNCLIRNSDQGEC
jgi:hypothetical protein